MARGTTLQELVRMVREEAGHSTSAALGQNTLEGLKNKIRRQQEILWLEHEWPHLRVEREITLEAGSRYYNFPADLSANHRIDEAHVFHDDEWIPLRHGITLAHYNHLNPDANERQDPVEAWELHEGEQIEVWPLPETNGVRVLLRGTRNLRPLIADADTADLDDRMLALFVAGEITAKQNQRDAEALLTMARNLFARLKSVNSKNRVFRNGDPRYHATAGGPDVPRARPLYGREQ